MTRNEPVNICYQCLKDLLDFHIFRQKCVEVNAELERIYISNGWCLSESTLSIQQTSAYEEENKRLPGPQFEFSEFENENQFLGGELPDLRDLENDVLSGNLTIILMGKTSPFSIVVIQSSSKYFY